MLSKLIFWLWHRSIARRLMGNPVGAFMWELRVKLVYTPLLKAHGFQEVMQEHERWTKTLKTTA